MGRKLFFVTGLSIFFLSASAFQLQQPVLLGLQNWAALGVVLVIILFLALLLIFQRSQVPSALARYHLDHAEHSQAGEHGSDSHTGEGHDEYLEAPAGEITETTEASASSVDVEEAPAE